MARKAYDTYDGGDLLVFKNGVEVHASGSLWSVVRSGSVYGTYDSKSYAVSVAKSLARRKSNPARKPKRNAARAPKARTISLKGFTGKVRQSSDGSLQILGRGKRK